MTSLEGFRQIALILEIFVEHWADPTAQITWTRQGCISSTRRIFKRTATEQIRASFIDCFSAEDRPVSHDDEDTIAFVSCEDITSRNRLPTYFLASTGSHRMIPHLVPLFQPAQVGNAFSQSTSQAQPVRNDT